MNDLATEGNEFVKNETLMDEAQSKNHETNQSAIVQCYSVHPPLAISATTLPLGQPHADSPLR